MDYKMSNLALGYLSIGAVMMTIPSETSSKKKIYEAAH